MNRWKAWFSQMRSADMGGGAESARRAEVLKAWRAEKSGDGRGVGLIHTVCREVASVACAEMRAVTGNEEVAHALKGLAPALGGAVMSVLGVGEGMFRLYPRGEGEEASVGVEFLLPDQYEVTARDESGRACGVKFFEQVREGEKTYCHIEEHGKRGGDVYISHRLTEVGGGSAARAVPLSRLERFASLTPTVVLEGVPFGMFYEWKLCGDGREVGEALWERAKGLIRDADRQYDRMLWEYEGGELAIDASEDAFRVDRRGVVQLPKGKERLYRMNLLDGAGTDGELMKVFAPKLRDEAMIRGLNRILMLIEDAIGLSRGTLADPSEVARSATEVKAMRQRTHLTAQGIRGQMKVIWDAICARAFVLLTLSGINVKEEEMPVLCLGDGVLGSGEEDRAADREDVGAGIMTREEYRARWYGERSKE